MNSTVASCPYEDRRTSAGLYSKLVVFSLIAVCSLIHLIYLRRDFRLASVLLLCAITSPITIAVHLFLPIPILAVEFLIFRDTDRLWQSIGTIIGSKEDEKRYTLVGSKVSIGRLDLAWITIQRILCSLILFLSVASIYLFTRRSATALVDHYILQLGLIGMLASVLALTQLSMKLCEPEKSWLTFVAGRYDFFRYFSPCLLLHLHILGTVTALLVRAFGLDVPPAFPAYMWNLKHFRRDRFWIAVTSTILIAYGGYWIFTLGSAIEALRRVRNRNTLRDWFHDWFSWKTLGHSFWALTAVICGWGILFLAIVGFDVVIFTINAEQYNGMLLAPAKDYLNHTTGAISCPNVLDWNRIATFDAVPVSCPCPVALRDGVADLGWTWA